MSDYDEICDLRHALRAAELECDAALDALEQVKAALGDRLLGEGTLSKEYADSVFRRINAVLLIAGRIP